MRRGRRVQMVQAGCASCACWRSLQASLEASGALRPSEERLTMSGQGDG